MLFSEQLLYLFLLLTVLPTKHDVPPSIQAINLLSAPDSYYPFHMNELGNNFQHKSVIDFLHQSINCNNVKTNYLNSRCQNSSEGDINLRKLADKLLDMEAEKRWKRSEGEERNGFNVKCHRPAVQVDKIS